MERVKMFNIKEFLLRYKMVGQIYPWKKDDPREPVIALLVPISSALEEYNHWSKQDYTKDQFLRELKDNSIHVFSSLEQFNKFKNNLKELDKIVKANKVKHTRTLSEERKLALKEHAAAIRAKLKPSISKTL
jgi:Tfp pilus assembly protein PilO